MLNYRKHTDKKTWLQQTNVYRKNGLTAFRAGKLATDNPYKLGGSAHNAWEAGFIAGQKEGKNYE